MKTIIGENIYEFVINKSVFISYIKHVKTTDEAKQYIKEIKTKHFDATHNVPAYIVGKTGEHGHMSDDGEPSGTAGMPIFDCLRKNNLTNIVCVVTRYYGGILLGAGGLVRAYTKAASENIKLASICDIIRMAKIKITFNYPSLNKIETLLKNYSITDKMFTTNVSLIVVLPFDDIEKVTAELIALTSNTAILEIIDNDLTNI